MSYPELENLIETLRSRPKVADIDERRKLMNSNANHFPTADDVILETLSLGGVSAEKSCTPADDKEGALLYVHGGGYVIGSLDSHRHTVTEAGRAAGIPAYALDYRLAPETPFPAPVDDTLSAYRALLSRDIKPTRIAIAGDSAGGGLVISALVAIRNAGLPQPACGWSMSPWVDMEAMGESMRTNAPNDPTVQRDVILDYAQHYLAGADPRSPLAAPIYADLTGIAPLLIQVGAIETLLDDAVRLTQRAASAGVATRLDIWPDMPHVWHLFHPILTAGRKALEDGGEFVRMAIANGAPFTYPA